MRKSLIFLHIAKRIITNPASENTERPKLVSANAMSDVTYKALFTGIVMGLTFALVTFMVGFYVIK